MANGPNSRLAFLAKLNRRTYLKIGPANFSYKGETVRNCKGPVRLGSSEFNEIKMPKSLS